MAALLIAYIPTSMLALRALPWAKIPSAKSITYFLTDPYKSLKVSRNLSKLALGASPLFTSPITR